MLSSLFFFPTFGADFKMYFLSDMSELQNIYFWHYGSDDLPSSICLSFMLLCTYAGNIFKADLPVT